MTFEFIDNNSKIDPRTRKRIRSLVATGKNAGKTVVRPSRIKALKEQLTHPVAFPSAQIHSELTQSESSSEETVLPIERPIGDDVCYFFTSSQPNLASRSLAKRDCLTQQSSPSRDAIHHLCQTFRLVNKKLSDNVVPLSTIATILMLAQYERHQSQHYQGLIHLNGLLRLINVRGGVLEVQKEMPIIMQKAFRVDLDFALYMGTATIFNVNHVLASRAIIFGSGVCPLHHLRCTVDSSLLGFSMNLSIDLHNALVEAMSLSRQLNDAAETKALKVNLYFFNANIILLGYQVISISPLSQSYQLSRLENSIHLGLAMFVTTFMNRLDRKIPDMPFMSELLRVLLTFDFQVHLSVLLWLLFLGNATILGPNDQEWLAPMVATTAQKLGLYSWNGVSKALVKLPWVNSLYNSSSQSLWLKASTYYESPFVEKSSASPNLHLV
ncbi:conserved hypothetical protein [Talaromyces stipitatus ATCC 10500]|uniref:Tachykinin family protein n=1 Tax=Talaromyces stipitatus (strain ATCC 10500 / CBS 375.48 / QM 6759 / NRRL 1006) TaxID=441959 RepID=B8M948_TALSN|nr:uncharacterized protein TSTA_111790 [Talaromyces stipitatus ATCC 10500]EED17343.1 conserved hypothetical protein [Talaromyces stipitatus ATCC 10500]